ncbi:MAG: recombinase family protein [FCB group bacterium]|jgi:DNA invertase Pin-like site-specific DNA recombinase|nr:recombinase family protein [FCB group bacterium]
MKERAIIYTRFSPRRNAEDCESCEVQAAQCEQFAARADWEISGTFEDRDASGSDADRPGLAAAIAALERGDILLVYKRDRLARDVLIAELTRRRVAAVGARIVAVSGDIDGDANDPTVVFVRQIMDAVAELERKQIAARTRDAMHQHQRNGRRMGRYAPYGWSLDAADPSTLVPEPIERQAIDRIRALAAGGMTVAAICRQMGQEMPEAARGEKWNRRTVMKIIDRAC